MATAEHQPQRGNRAYDKKAKASQLELGDRVLVRKVRFKEGPHKLDHVWKKDVYEVVDVPNKDYLVYDVRDENNH